MKKTMVFLLTCFLITGFTQQSKAQDISSQKKPGIEKEIDSLFHASIKSAEGLDYDKLMQGVDDRHEAGFISNGNYYMRFDSLLNFARSRSQGISKQRISLAGKQITVLSETIALVSAYGDTTVETTNGNSFTIKFFWSFVYEKINNDWKVIQSHQSSSR